MAGLSCELGDLLSAYLDAELQPGELEVLADHLGACEACVLEFRRLKEARAALRLMPRLQVPEDVMVSIFHLGPELSAYLDGELEQYEIPLVVDHLSRCERCRDELQELDSARAAVRSLPTVEQPAVIPLPTKSSARGRWTRRFVGAAAAAAAVIVLALGVTGSGSAPAPVDLDAIADRHGARASLESGPQFLPAVLTEGVSP